MFEWTKVARVQLKLLRIRKAETRTLDLQTMSTINGKGEIGSINPNGSRYTQPGAWAGYYFVVRDQLQAELLCVHGATAPLGLADTLLPCCPMNACLNKIA